MPKASWSPAVKQRVSCFLEELLSYVSDYRNDLQVQYRWEDESSDRPKLIVEAKLRFLVEIAKLEKNGHFYEVINRLKDLDLCEDRRFHTKGKDDWHFALKLWSKDLQKNLQEFNRAWESKRPEKSKKLNPYLQKPKALEKLCIQVPDLPMNFLPRADELKKVKSLLLESGNQRVAVTGISHRLGLQGMGGIGKSVLAAILARDEDVQGVFPDGIFWVTLGQQPALTLRQLDLAKMLGDSSQIFQDVQQGRVLLSKLLADKACLLILDDIWQSKHAEAFNVVGQKSKILITTRDRQVLKEFGAVEHTLGLLNDGEALELLALWAKQGKEKLPIEAQEVVKECGKLPLALAMIGAIVRDKPDRWANVLHKLRNADLEKIRHQFSDYPYPDLLKAMQVSVEALEPNLQRRYLDFAVFPEDTPIPEAVLKTFWQPEGLDEFDTQDVMDVLVDRSLARRDDKGCLTLHDLQYDYVRKQAGDLAALHNQILTAYAKCCPNGWHTGQNDGYFFENLAYHLKESGRNAELYTLLTQSPDWMEAKFIACQGDAAYVADLQLAINDFADPLKANHLITLIKLHTARQVVNRRISIYNNDDLVTLVCLNREAEALNYARLRHNDKERFYGLIVIYKALNKRQIYKPEILKEAWNITESMEKLVKIEALWHLLLSMQKINSNTDFNKIFSELNKEFYKAVQGLFKNKRHKSDSYSLVKEKESEIFLNVFIKIGILYDYAFDNNNRKIVNFFEDFVQALIEYNDLDSEIYLSTLATALANTNQVAEAHRVSKLIQQNWLKIKTLSQLSKIAIKKGLQPVANLLITEAQKIVPSLDGSFRSEQALVELVSATAISGDIQQAEEFLLMIENTKLHSEALMELSITFSLFQNFSKAEEFIQKIEDKQIKKNALSALTVKLAQSGHQVKATLLLREIKQEALSLEDNFDLPAALSGLTKLLAQSNFLDEAQKVINFIKDDPKQEGYAFNSLVNSLIQTGDLKQAEKIARQISDRYYFCQTLKDLSIALYNQGKNKYAIMLINEALEAAKLVKNDPHRLWLMTDLAFAFNCINKPKNANTIFLTAERIARQLETDFFQIQALTILLNSLYKVGDTERADKLLTEIEEMILEMDNPFDQPFLLDNLTQVLARFGFCSKAKKVAGLIENTPEKIVALYSLAEAFYQQGQEVEAEEIFSEIKKDWDLICKDMDEESLGEISVTLAQIGQFADGLAKMKLQKLDSFVSLLTDCATAFEKLECGLSIVILREVVRIVGWISPHWQQIYQILPDIERR